MHRFWVGVVWSSLLACVLACATTNPRDANYLARAQQMQQADAKMDVRRAIQHRDLRFLAVYGLTRDIPGIPDDVARSLKDSDINAIEDTSDARESGAHTAFNEAAWDYAERYNRELLQQISKLPSKETPAPAAQPTNHQ